MIQCPYCHAKGWCMKNDSFGPRRAGYTHKSRVKLWHKVLRLMRGGLM